MDLQRHRFVIIRFITSFNKNKSLFIKYLTRIPLAKIPYILYDNCFKFYVSN